MCTRCPRAPDPCTFAIACPRLCTFPIWPYSVHEGRPSTVTGVMQTRYVASHFCYVDSASRRVQLQLTLYLDPVAVNFPHRHAMRSHPMFGSWCAWALLAALLTACEGLSLAAPEGEATLQVQGTVRDAASGAPVANAKVAIVVGWSDLATARTDTEGRYSLTHRLKHVARDREFRDSCHIWLNDTAHSVTMDVEATGYPSWAALEASAVLRCTDELQTMHFRLRK